MDEIIKRSGAGTRATNVFSKFISGKGFKDQVFANMIVNSKGMTANELLRFNARDKAKFKGFALHVGYNMLYEISTVNPVFFKFCRFGIPDDNGNIHDILFSTNWEKDKKKEKSGFVSAPEKFPVFNPDPGVVRRQIEQAGGIANYKGQILYFTPDPNLYPECTFDPVVDDVQANAEIPLFQLKNIQHGFAANGVFKYPGTFESDDERNQVLGEVNKMTGAEAAGTTMLVEMGDRDISETGSLFESMVIPSVDSLFVNQNKNIKDSIKENYGIPAPLLGMSKDSGVFSREEYQEAFDIYNSETQDDRMIVEDVYFKVFFHFRKLAITKKSVEIEPNTFGDNKAPDKIPTEFLKDLTPSERREIIGFEKLETGQEQSEQLLSEKLGAGGTQSLIAILTNELLSKEQKINTIVTLFGLSPEQAVSLVNPTPAQNVS